MPNANAPIVSSMHLMSPVSPELSELEYGLTMTSNAFHKWVTRCMAAAGVDDMTALEVLLLHHVNHRERKKKLADICFVLNIEDTHVASYSLKKLVSRGYVTTEKNGKEVLFSTTDEGKALCEKYRHIRETCLMATLPDSGLTNEQISSVALLLRSVSGIYDTAARVAASL